MTAEAGGAKMQIWILDRVGIALRKLVPRAASETHPHESLLQLEVKQLKQAWHSLGGRTNFLAAKSQSSFDWPRVIPSINKLGEIIVFTLHQLVYYFAFRGLSSCCSSVILTDLLSQSN